MKGIPKDLLHPLHPCQIFQSSSNLSSFNISFRVFCLFGVFRGYDGMLTTEYAENIQKKPKKNSTATRRSSGDFDLLCFRPCRS